MPCRQSLEMAVGICLTALGFHSEKIAWKCTGKMKSLEKTAQSQRYEPFQKLGYYTDTYGILPCHEISLITFLVGY